MRLLAALFALHLIACGDDAGSAKQEVSTSTSTTDTAVGTEVSTTTSEPDATVSPTDATATTTEPDVVSEDSEVVEDSEPQETSEPPDVPITVVRAPVAGDIAFSELMIDPVGRSDLTAEWIELASLTVADTLDLASCWLEDGDGHRVDFADHGLLRLRSGERFLVARAADDNGGLDPDLVQTSVLMANAAGRVTFGCSADALDTVAWDDAWPLAPGRALQVAPDPTLNDAVANACAATSIYDDLGPNRGTPGAIDEACPPPDTTIDECLLVAPSDMTLRAGDAQAFAALEARAWVHEAGETDLSAVIDPIPGFVAEVGVAKGANAPTWSAALPDVDHLDPNHPERDTWHGAIRDDGKELGIGLWTVSFRVSRDGGDTWKTCGDATLTVVPSPCDPNPCSRAAELGCDGDVATASPDLGTCSVIDDAAACAWPVTRIDCTALGGTCAAGDCIGVAGHPAIGSVIIDEVMRNPNAVEDAVGEWFELVNLGTDTVQLSGCVLSDDTTDYVMLAAPGDDVGALTLAPGERVALAAERDAGRNGGVEAAVGWSALGTFTLDNNNDAIILSCDDEVIDVVRYTSAFPNFSGRSMQLSPRKLDATWNDLAASWCTSQNATGGGTFPDYGSPGLENPPCPENVERCRLVAPPGLEVVAGSAFTVAIQFRHPGVSDVSSATDLDSLVMVEGGMAPVGYYPYWGSWVYTPAVPDDTWSDATFPLEDQWLATMIADPQYDQRDVAGRVSVDGGLSWVWCDRDSGLANGDGSQDGYSPANATSLFIVPADPCRPNPCTTPPDNRCDPDGLVVYPESGTCTVVDDEAECAFTYDTFDCDALDGTCDALAGACVGAMGHPGRGDLVITEVMVSPRAVADFFGEWIELTSVAGESLNLDGCVLADADGGVPIAVPGHALVVEAGERFVIARQGAQNGGVDAKWTWGGSLGLGNIGDKIELRCDDDVVDTLAWDASWPFAPGVAMQLTDAIVDAALNDDVDAWCAASTPYGSGDLGTPAATNATCP